VIPLLGGSPLVCRGADRRGAVRVERSGRPAQVRVKVWGATKEQGEHAIGCEMTISDWLGAGYDVESVAGWERSTRPAGASPRGSPRSRKAPVDWGWAPPVAGR
jgi:hypothetical protein